MIQHVTKDDFEKEVLRSDKPVLVDFYADWCGPCKIQTRILEGLGEEFDKAKILKVNVDDESDLAAEFDVQSIPTLIVFKDGKLDKKVTGVTQVAGLKELLGI